MAGLIVLVSVVAGSACTPDANGAQEASVVPTDLQVASERADKARIKGDDDAMVRIVEISDFECPYCAQFYSDTYHALDSLYVQTGKVSYVWISYANPGHPRAWPSIEAAFCAGTVGKFWPMHSILFERQAEWRQAENLFDLFVEYAVELNIDAESFTVCMRDDILAPMQVRDYTNVVRAGISSTPYFIIGDSVAVRGAAPLETFTAAIDTMLVIRTAEAASADAEQPAAAERTEENPDQPDQ
jgi:protein-disulfide isomerase